MGKIADRRRLKPPCLARSRSDAALCDMAWSLAGRLFGYPKPAKPEPNRWFWTHCSLGCTGNFGWSADPHPPGCSRSAGAKQTNPVGLRHSGASM